MSAFIVLFLIALLAVAGVVGLFVWNLG